MRVQGETVPPNIEHRVGVLTEGTTEEPGTINRQSQDPSTIHVSNWKHKGSYPLSNTLTPLDSVALSTGETDALYGKEFKQRTRYARMVSSLLSKDENLVDILKDDTQLCYFLQRNLVPSKQMSKETVGEPGAVLDLQRENPQLKVENTALRNQLENRRA
ncbi:hypothetical protein HAX54_046033 [Datura stramonium]|uniref:Uncharacterized protein n=1 Tax=Datura stramonium TaxID=4076 RepID=A0ABS8WL89_DATST|nr:hypothetical protein [Datura stramonium]